jgi:RNA polymerase sigma-70 factor (ECF subfamily)
MSDADDWALVERARGGDMPAFAALVRRYQAPVIHFCQRMCGSLPDAEDLAQEAFVRLYRHLPRLQQKARFSTVMFGIARNLALNHLRDANRRGRGRVDALDDVSLSLPAHERPDALARTSEMEALVAAGIEKLSDEHREVLILRDVQGMDYDAIANVIQCQKGTVRSRLSRAREQLRLVLREMGALT